MNFLNLYRVSFYVMLVFATLVLSVDATDNRLSMLFPLAVAVSAVLAFVFVDRKHDLIVTNGARPSAAGPVGPAVVELGSRAWLNLAAVVLTAVAIGEYWYDNNQLMLALGHWLVFLQIILILRPKSVAEDWELFLLGLVQVLVGTVISSGDVVGPMLFTWAVLALWVLGLFSLRREAIRARGRGKAGSQAAPGATEGELYPGLLNVPFLLSALRVTLTTLALGGVIFLAMPRRVGLARTRGGDIPGQHLTGFDDEVQLGQLGEILENDSVVMSVELFDADGTRLAPTGELLWRGVTMSTYKKGRWFRQGRDTSTFAPTLPSWVRNQFASRSVEKIRQQIKLEANDSAVLFGLRPMIDSTAGRRYGPELNAVDGTIFRNDTRGGSIDYEVVSFRDAELPQPGESLPGPYRMKTRLIDVPEDIRPRLAEIAVREIEARVPLDQRQDVRKRAEALNVYLRESGQFGYTLKLDVVDPSIDPVLDFLVNRKEGHCEYFASALTLLLRSAGMPARMVNGFKGGDWNDLARVLSVRQKHAHSWVEVYLGETEGPDRAPIWLTLDPTPGIERDRSVARVGGFKANFYQITDAVRYVWVFYIVGFDAERQNKVVYGPIRALVGEARRGFVMMGQALVRARDWLRRQLHFPDAQSFVSVRGFAVSFIALTLLAAVARGAAWLVERLTGWRRGRDDDLTAHSAGVAHYRRLEHLLAALGKQRDSTQTQREFAVEAARFLKERSETQSVADVPLAVVDVFYRVRFGHHDVGEAVLSLLENRLDTLEASLKAAQT